MRSSEAKHLAGIESSQSVILEAGESVPVTSGVPQGSVLGLILFQTYANDLPEQSVSHVRLFADDTAIYLAWIGAECSKMILTPCLCRGPQVVRATTSRTQINYYIMKTCPCNKHIFFEL